ncbi:hypothetical protein A3Q56_01591 [Intoshia linei]|uniref:Uncharacterized protein n=1 Tax=Intoshia linei TaxID=1819745 RepID=A0A177B8U7_9BILA|nr:hypothetical protein A3Q56_01591 [Intoshia linei]
MNIHSQTRDYLVDLNINNISRIFKKRDINLMKNKTKQYIKPKFELYAISPQNLTLPKITTFNENEAENKNESVDQTEKPLVACMDDRGCVTLTDTKIKKISQNLYFNKKQRYVQRAESYLSENFYKPPKNKNTIDTKHKDPESVITVKKVSFKENYDFSPKYSFSDPKQVRYVHHQKLYSQFPIWQKSKGVPSNRNSTNIDFKRYQQYYKDKMYLDESTIEELMQNIGIQCRSEIGVSDNKYSKRLNYKDKHGCIIKRIFKQPFSAVKVNPWNETKSLMKVNRCLNSSFNITAGLHSTGHSESMKRGT